MRTRGAAEAAAGSSLTSVVPAQASEGDRRMLRMLTGSQHPIVTSFPHGALFVFDHDLRYLSAGGLGLRDVGLTREALEGKTIYEAFPPVTSAAIEPLYRAALSGQSTTSDVPYAGRTFTQRLSPIRNEQGVVLAGMGFTQDVTETRLGEQRLRESEQRFRLAFQHAPIGKAIVDLDGRFREVNPGLCRLFGYTSDELRALTFQDITHPDDLDANLSQLARVLVGEIDGYSMDKRYYTASGALLWATLAVSLVLADDGEPLYFVAQVQDITDRKANEQLLARAQAVHEAALEHAATHDGLTGLANRRLVQQRLTSLLAAPGRRERDGRVAVLFCDLDGFKSVNDEHGHEAGDRVLREAAERLTVGARAGDTVGRLGGDEFVVLITTQAGEDVRALTEAVARRICTAMAAPFHLPGLTLSITISVGISLPERGSAAEESLREADAAMYAAKRGGKNGFAFHHHRAGPDRTASLVLP